MRALSILIRVLALPLHISALWLHRAASAVTRPRYQIRGACRHSGQCCRQLLLAEAPFLTWPVLGTVTRFWMERIYPFEIGDTAVMDPDSGAFFRVLRCRNLVDGRCREYWLRPRLCRAWPEPADESPPVLFRGCGYWAVDSCAADQVDVARRRQSLEWGAEQLAQRWRSASRRSRGGGDGGGAGG